MSDTVNGIGRTVGVALVRPEDTNAYAPGDVIGTSASAGVNVIINDVGINERGFTIIQEALLIDSASAATRPDIEVWLFNEPVTNMNDNAAFNPTDAEMLSCVGVLVFPVGSFRVGLASGNCLCETGPISKPVNCIKKTPGAASSGGALYPVFVVRNAYAPSSAESLTLLLKCID